MTWLEGNGRDARPAGVRLKELLDPPGILGVPGAHGPVLGLAVDRQRDVREHRACAVTLAETCHDDRGLHATNLDIFQCYTRGIT